MAKKNLNMDNFFRKKLSGYEAPELKGNWQLLNHLLDARERRKRMAWKIFFGSLFLVCLLVGYFIFTPGNREGQQITANNKNSGSPISSAPVSDSIQNHTSGTIKTSSNENKITENAPTNSIGNKDGDGIQKNIAENAQSNSVKTSTQKATAKQIQKAV